MGLVVAGGAGGGDITLDPGDGRCHFGRGSVLQIAPTSCDLSAVVDWESCIHGARALIFTLGAAFLAGCGTRGLQVIASGQIGCPADEIEISDVDAGMSSSTWVATCRGVRHYCSNWTSGAATSPGAYVPPSPGTSGAAAFLPGATGYSSTASCKAEIADPSRGPAGAPPPAAPRSRDPEQATTATGSATEQPPAGAAGFLFGEARDASEKACQAAGKQWAIESNAEKARCSGPASEIGADAAVQLKYCTDKLCAITLLVVLPEEHSSLWVNQYKKLGNHLVQKYGPSQERTSEHVPAECETSLRGCFEDGRLVFDSRWKWADAHSIRLVLGRIDGAVRLALVYRDGADKKVPPPAPPPPAGL